MVKFRPDLLSEILKDENKSSGNEMVDLMRMNLKNALRHGDFKDDFYDYQDDYEYVDFDEEDENNFSCIPLGLLDSLMENSYFVLRRRTYA